MSRTRVIKILKSQTNSCCLYLLKDHPEFPFEIFSCSFFLFLRGILPSLNWCAFSLAIIKTYLCKLFFPAVSFLCVLYLLACFLEIFGYFGIYFVIVEVSWRICGWKQEKKNLTPGNLSKKYISEQNAWLVCTVIFNLF